MRMGYHSPALRSHRPAPRPQNMYFSKEDERLLRNLLIKMKGQADQVRGREEERDVREIV